MNQFLAQALEAFGPLVLKLIEEWQDANDTTDLPTMDQLRADYHATIQSYLAEGAAWRAAHPDA